MPAKLKPCPFCGGEAKLMKYGNSHYVSCLKCSVSTVRSFQECGEGNEHAISLWNERVDTKEENLKLPTTQVKSSADATAEQICRCKEGNRWHLLNGILESKEICFCPSCGGKLLLTANRYRQFHS